MISADRLSEIFVEVADTLVADFDLQEFLHNLARRTVAVSGVDAAGILLADQDNRLRFMAASSEPAKFLELIQLQAHGGPCLDAFRTREAVIVADIAEVGSRWPEFSPRALDLGFQSVHAIPMRLNDQVIGALNLFGLDNVPLSETDTRIVQALANVATIGILQERAINRAATLNEQLQAALNSRVVIEQAKGAIAQSRDIGVDAAFDLLRGYARSHGRRIGDAARTVVTDPGRISDIPDNRAH